MQSSESATVTVMTVRGLLNRGSRKEYFAAGVTGIEELERNLSRRISIAGRTVNVEMTQMTTPPAAMIPSSAMPLKSVNANVAKARATVAAAMMIVRMLALRPISMALTPSAPFRSSS